MILKIEHDPNQKMFFADIEGRRAKLEYEVIADGKTLDYRHTYVPPELRGKQIGQQLVSFALEYAQSRGVKIVPTCPFIKKYIHDHPEYRGLIAH